MDKIKARFGKKQGISPLAAATKDFIKGSGDDGLQFLPLILEACSSASEWSLTSQIEVLDIIAKYYVQKDSLTRQLRCIDLLRYLSDQHDNDLFNLLAQGHPLLNSIDSTLKHARSQTPLQKHTRVLLDHLVRQPNVPDAIIELHAKHVTGSNKAHKSTIILSDLEVVADDIAAGSAESELLVALLTEGKADRSLVKEVFGRISSTRERLLRDIDTSTVEAQTVNLIETVEKIDRVLVIYKEMGPDSLANDNKASDQHGQDIYVAPQRSSFDVGAARTPQERVSSRAGKSKASYDSDEDKLFDMRQFKDTILPDDNHGEGSSSRNHYFEQTTSSFSGVVTPDSPVSSQDAVRQTNGHSPLSSNNPFAMRPTETLVGGRNFSPRNPYAAIASSPSNISKNPFTDI